MHWRKNVFECQTYCLNLIQLGLLLLNGFLSTNLFTLIHPGSCCLLNHSKDLKENLWLNLEKAGRVVFKGSESELGDNRYEFLTSGGFMFSTFVILP